MSSRYFIDLYSGCGGISLGLMQAGWKGLFAVEKDAMAFQTLLTNLIETKRSRRLDWPSWLELGPMKIEDILDGHRSELAELKGYVKLVAGGPPCQGFSLAGRRKTGDARNRLLRRYLEFVEIVEPDYLIIENVPGIAIYFGKKRYESEGVAPRGRNGSRSYADILIADLVAAGYSVFPFLLRAVEYGVPQYRPRYILIGIRTEYLKRSGFVDSEQPFDDVLVQLKECVRAKFLKAKGLQKLPVTVKQAISDLEVREDRIEEYRPTGPYSPRGKFMKIKYSVSRTKYQKLLHHGCDGEPNSLRLANHTERVVKRFKRIITKYRKGVQLTAAELEKLGLKKHVIVPLDPDKPSHTLTTLPDDILHYSEPRILTVREMARLQSFPDWFEFEGKYTTGGKLRSKQCPRYTQVGNAVPPFVAEYLGRLILEVDKELDKATAARLRKRHVGCETIPRRKLGNA